MRLWTPEREKTEAAKRDRSTERPRDNVGKVLKITVAATVVVLLMWMFRPADPVYRISFDASARTSGSDFVISGNTNLIDGAIVQYSVASPEGETIEGRTTVEDGGFEFTLAPDNINGVDSLDVALVFEIVMEDRIQHVEVVEQYGGFGEHLGGDYVVRDERGRHLKKEMTLEVEPGDS